MNLSALTLRELVDFHNSFIAVLPDLKPVTVTTYKSKAKMIEALGQLHILRPKHIAAMIGGTPYDTRGKLRSAVASGALGFQKNKHWALTMAQFHAVFIAPAGVLTEEAAPGGDLTPDAE